jgi:hypothetical protein
LGLPRFCLYWISSINPYYSFEDWDFDQEELGLFINNSIVGALGAERALDKRNDNQSFPNEIVKDNLKNHMLKECESYDPGHHAIVSNILDDILLYISVERPLIELGCTEQPLLNWDQSLNEGLSPFIKGMVNK